MNSFRRWVKFNAVGAMGMAVQLGALWMLNRCTPGHYLYASALAVELTLLHNFAWHLRYTWRDRREAGGVLARLLRFNLSNGLVSLVGNVVLMRALVQDGHVPVIAANVMAILCCSMVNFWLGNRWVFGEAVSQ